MPTYNYVKNDNSLGTFDATDANIAVSTLGSFGDANPNSGVSLVGNQNATSPVPEPTVGETLSPFSASSFDSQPSYEDIYGKPIDENKIYQNQLNLFQGQIDATNQVYDQLLGEARLQQTGRLGSQRAISARGGILGSDFSSSQKENVVQYGNDIERGIGAERAAAIGAILGNVRSSAQTELANKRAARQQGAENYLAYLASSSERKKNNITQIAQDLITQGYDPSQLDKKELDAIASEAGVSVQDIISGYAQVKSATDAAATEADQKSRKTEAEIAKIEADIASGKIKTLGEGSILYNTETGEYFKNPKTSAPGTGGVGTLLAPEEVSGVHVTLQNNRGQDGYTDTGKYLEQLDAYVQLGGDPKDFIKEYSPDVYINPNDSTRSFLQSQMKKPASDNIFLGGITQDLINSTISEVSNGE